MAGHQTNQTIMKVKFYSGILACVYLLCGVVLFFALFKFQEVFSGFGIALPLVTRVTLTVGPIGWLCLFVAVSLVVILKDLRFRSRSLNPLFTFGLVFCVVCMIIALLYPFDRIMIAIH
jgi:hypothetical protein